ncbi:MAG: hypothetical protein Q8T08_16300, partial [Ignavibacteria bacterium]|nr:hypothetical protein [Ignavibacteria bacterium]
MKNNKFLFFSFVAMLGLITLFPLSSCKNVVSPIEDIKLIIDYNIIKTSIDVHFYDVNTGQMLGTNTSGTAYVNVAGKDQMAVVDALGVKLDDSRTTINRGIATMALQPTAAYTPSPSKLVAFTLVTDVPGYLKTTQQVFISKV